MTRRTPVEDMDDWHPATFTGRTGITPQRAARVKARYYAIRLCTVPDDHLDALERNDGAHQWWLYCLNIVARQA